MFYCKKKERLKPSILLDTTNNTKKKNLRKTGCYGGEVIELLPFLILVFNRLLCEKIPDYARIIVARNIVETF